MHRCSSQARQTSDTPQGQVDLTGPPFTTFTTDFVVLSPRVTV